MTQDAMEKVINSIIESQKKELFSKTQEELEYYWSYDFNNINAPKIKLYTFYDALKNYEYNCSQWEEHHNGSICIVERVREKYILPKIKRFLEKQKEETDSS